MSITIPETETNISIPANRTICHGAFPSLVDPRSSGRIPVLGKRGTIVSANTFVEIAFVEVIHATSPDTILVIVVVLFPALVVLVPVQHIPS